jgi:CRP/FNR family cyclic AMP-dependent transcriptional regulator
MNAAPDVDWKRIALFEGFSDQWIDEVAAIFEPLDKKAGDILIEEGETGDELYILISGKVRVSKAMLAKDMHLPLMDMADPRKVLATLDQAGYPIFGEMALIDQDLRSATIAVVEDSRFLVTDRERFFGLAGKNPELGNRLLTVIGKRLAATIRRNNAELIKLSTALALSLSLSRTNQG